MKRLRLDQWASQLQPPRNPRIHLQRCPFSHETRAPRRELQQRQYQVQHQWQSERRHVGSKRRASSAAAVQEVEKVVDEIPLDAPLDVRSTRGARKTTYAPSPSPWRALGSAKLAALHARLSLPSKLPLQTLARCLIDPSADPRAGYNNASFAVIGQDLLGYYTSEHLITHYPRLPMSVLFAAQYAYVGAASLSNVRAEWGVEVVAAPGQEVDPGLLQLKRMVPGNSMIEGTGGRVKDMPGVRKLGSRLGTGRRNAEWNYRRGLSSRVVYDDEFGDLELGLPPSDSQPYPGAPLSTPADEGSSTTEISSELEEMAQNDILTPLTFSPLDTQTADETEPTTVEAASAAFVRALAGALYLHAGASASKTFHADHVLSRHLELHSMFNFTHPTRDLSRLCAREDFEPPVARLISETGRLSRTPVYVVGVYSGENLLGEAAGASLNEARVRASAAALRGWYLYSPPQSEIVRPSEVEGVSAGKGKGKVWRPQMMDAGEVVT